MAKGIDLSIAADTRSAMSAINRGLIDPLEDASEALEQLGDDGKDAGDDLEKGMRDAQRRTEDAADEIRRMRDELNKTGRQAKQTGDEIGDAGKGGFGKLGEAGREVTQEIGQNLGETVSSIRGDMTDLGQVGQDTLGGLAATLAGIGGPAGILGAGALAGTAVGVGLITAEVEKQNEQVKAMKQYYADAWQEAAEGGRDYLAVSGIIAEANSLRFDPERADEYNRIMADANKLGLDRNTLINAAAGDQTALNVVTERSRQLYDDATKALEEASNSRKDAMSDEEVLANQVASQMKDVNDRWQRYGDINDENRRKAEDATRATSDYLKSIVANSDEAAVSVDSLGNKMIELPDGTTFYVDAETGQAVTDLESFEDDADGVIDSLNGKQVVLRLATEDAIRAAQNAAAQIGGIKDKTVKLNADSSSIDSAIRRIQNTVLTVAIQAAATAGTWKK